MSSCSCQDHSQSSCCRKCLVEPRLVEHATMGTRPQAVLLVCVASPTKLTLEQLCSLLCMIKNEFGMKLGKKLTAAKFSKRKKIELLSRIAHVERYARLKRLGKESPPNDSMTKTSFRYTYNKLHIYYIWCMHIWV